MEFSLQTQFYMSYGVFAGVTVILVIWLIILCYSVEKMRKTTRSATKKLQMQLDEMNTPKEEESKPE